MILIVHIKDKESHSKAAADAVLSKSIIQDRRLIRACHLMHHLYSELSLSLCTAIREIDSDHTKSNALEKIIAKIPQQQSLFLAADGDEAAAEAYVHLVEELKGALAKVSHEKREQLQLLREHHLNLNAFSAPSQPDVRGHAQQADISGLVSIEFASSLDPAHIKTIFQSHSSPPPSPPPPTSYALPLLASDLSHSPTTAPLVKVDLAEEAGSNGRGAVFGGGGGSASSNVSIEDCPAALASQPQLTPVSSTINIDSMFKTAAAQSSSMPTASPAAQFHRSPSSFSPPALISSPLRDSRHHLSRSLPIMCDNSNPAPYSPRRFVSNPQPTSTAVVA
jgi:hypothetical protein